MSHRPRFLVAAFVLIALAGAAGWLGMWQLERRPMHADESVHAEKFGKMLAEPGPGQYVYNPNEYHGPTLYYVTHLVAAAYGKDSLQQLEARHLRTTSVLFGAALVLCLVLLVDGLSPIGAIISALLTMVTPLIVYFSRDFIHETTFVFFTMLTIAAGWRYTRAAAGSIRRALWAGLFGAGVGLMWASKEQVAMVMAAMTVAFAFNWICRQIANRRQQKVGRARDPAPAKSRPAEAPSIQQAEDDEGAVESATEPTTASSQPLHKRVPWRDVVLAGAALLAVWVTLFSSFFTNWFVTGGSGLRDSFMTYFSYLGRGMGEGEAAAIHVQPWWYYPWLLGWVSHPPAPVWTNALTLGLALIGGLVGFWPRWAGRSDPRLARFLAVYALILVLVFSVIPYKQPWLMMGPLHALILLAGIGAAALLRGARHAPASVVGITLAGIGLLIGYVSLPYQPTGFWIAGITALVLAAALTLSILMRVMPRGVAQIAVALALATGLAHLAHQTRWASTRYAADARNPLSHAQTSTNVLELQKFLNHLAAHHPKGKAMPVRVVSAVPWPLPWYLRRFEQVGMYDTKRRMKRGSLDAAALIIDTRFRDVVDQRLENEGLSDAYEAQKTSVYGLRPGVFLRVYVKNELWQRFMEDRR